MARQPARPIWTAAAALINAVVLALAAPVLAARFSPVITGFTPRVGSLAGGTLLRIQGQNFLDIAASEPVITVGGKPCTVVPWLSTHSQLACTTAPWQEGTPTQGLPISINARWEACCFAYSSSSTPVVTEVRQGGELPAGIVQLLGPALWPMQQMGAGQEVPTVTLLGGAVCQVSDEDGMAFGVDSSNVFRLNCSIPTTSGSLPAFSSNATADFSTGTLFTVGAAAIAKGAYFADRNNTPYLVQAAPEVSIVEPRTGSPGGGQLLTIRGARFLPAGADGAPAAIQVSVSGRPCTVQSTSLTEITCRTEAQGGGGRPGWQDPRTPLFMQTGRHPGGRGIQLARFDTPANFSNNGGNGLRSLATWQPLSSNTSLLMDAMRAVPSSKENILSRLTAFFVAPHAGSYRFYCTSDDSGQLWATRQLPNGNVTSTLLCSVNSWASYSPTTGPDWAKLSSQESAPLELNAGEHLLLEAYAQQFTGSDYLAVGVRIPSATRQWNSVPEVQTVSLSVQQFGQQQALQLTAYQPGVGVLTASVTNASPGTELILTSSNISSTSNTSSCNWALGSGTEQVQACLSALLGVPLSSLEVSVSTVPTQQGVEGSTAEVLQVQLEVALAPGFADLAASLDAQLAVQATSPDGPQLSTTTILSEGLGGSMDVLTAADAYTFRTLPAQATAQQVAEAVGQLVPDLPANVTVTRTTASAGLRQGFRWLLTFPALAGDSVPAISLAVEGLATGPGLRTSAALTRAASQPLGGSFRLAFAGSEASIDVPHNASSDDVKAALQGLPGVGAAVAVQLTGSVTGNRTWTLTFDPLTTAACNVPPLAASWEGLQGTAARVTAATVSDGSCDLLLRPIPADYLRRSVSAPGVVEVWVNNVLALCTAANTTDCSFSYLPTATFPSITSIAANDPAVPGSLIQIHGSGLDRGTGAEVFLGASLCTLASRTQVLIQCTVSPDTPAGWRSVSVLLGGLGAPLMAPGVDTDLLVNSLVLLAAQPATLAQDVPVLVTLTANGIDETACGAYQMYLGADLCTVITCNSSALTCAVNPSEAGLVDVTLEFVADNSTTLLTAQLAGGVEVLPPSAAGSTTAPRMLVFMPEILPAAGGLIEVELEGIGGASEIHAVRLHPLFLTPGSSFPQAAPSSASSFTWAAPGTLTILVLPSAPGPHSVHVELASGLVLVSPEPLELVLEVTGVSPPLGSMGGGTLLTLDGIGFVDESGLLARGERGTPVVLLRVPLSTTHPNGVHLCDLAEANATFVTCRTRPYCSADVSAEDPSATACSPLSSPPGAVEVVLCPTKWLSKDALKLYCWAQPDTPRAVCSQPGCSFSYHAPSTPRLLSASPQVVFQGQHVVATSQNADNDTLVVVTGSKSGNEQPCSITTVAPDGSSLTCTLPGAMVAGRYSLSLQRRSAEGGTDLGLGSVPLAVPATIESIEPSVGSLAGGTLLRLVTGGAGLNTTHPAAAHEVLLGGVLPCTLLSAGLSELTCRTRSLYGLVMAEYFALPLYTPWERRAVPSAIPGLQPTVRTFETGLIFNWGDGAPVGLSQTDFWASRFSGALHIPSPGNYSFAVSADDGWALTVGTQAVANSSQELFLEAGFSAFQLEHFEFTGLATLSMRYRLNGSSWQTIPPTMLLPLLPGNPVPLTLVVNGVPAVPACEGGEAEGCFFTFTTSATPLVASIAPQQVAAPVGAELSLSGSGFGSDAGLIRLTVGGADCPVSGTVNDSTVTCLVPALPAGIYPIELTVAGRGAAVLASGASSLTYLAAATGISPAFGSRFGGTEVALVGHGFAANGDSEVALLDRVSAVRLGAIPCVVSSATATSIRCTTGASASSADLAAPLATEVRNATTGLALPGTAALNSSVPFRYAASHTPLLHSVQPTSLAPHTAANITLSWWTPNASALVVASPGSTSLATVQLLGSSEPVTCTSPVLVAANVTGAGAYEETFSCTLPPLPAGQWALRLLVSPLGFTNTTNITVPLVINSITPFAGSLAGGTVLNLTGSGFSLNTSKITVLIGGSNGSAIGSPCQVLAAAQGWVSCRTSAFRGQLAPGAATSGPLPIFIAPSDAGKLLGQVAAPGVGFEYSSALTPTVTAISPSRGSTEGGTRLTISGSGFSSDPSNIQVSIGQWPCLSPAIVNDTSLTCVTSKPSSKPSGPLPVLVTVSPDGIAQGAVLYHYIDLWSRATTWGGSLEGLPLEGDSVVVPSGTFVLLDVSTPVLDVLILEGTLAFDGTASQELHLAAHRILINGGQLLAGAPGEPFPGSATITLHGDRGDLQMPIYGTKAIGLRDGNVTLVGMPKLPTWTLLNTTADVGDTSITINGAVNWQAGDRLVIASSSMKPSDVDEAGIVGVQPLSNGNTRLDLSTPLLFTHLGVVVTVPGEERVVDMRAEVAVLSRNIVVQGDEGSEDMQFGVHILTHSPAHMARASLVLEQVEVRRAGQAGGLGRYPVHMHLHGNGSASYVQGCSIHDTYQRAVTLHGTNNSRLTDNVAYNVRGHTFFLEDGSETGNRMTGNLAILTRRVDVGLNTDTTPASFWITNPANHIVGNRAAGSEGYGFWYRLQDFADGPSASPFICPKFTQLGAFANNVAHSNTFYGLRIHPEYYPSTKHCGVTSISAAPAVFRGLTAWKNGMKGAIATQVGLVQFANISLADNGAGAVQHKINGKDNGGAFEIAWVQDTRRISRTPLESMAGVQGALIIARTLEGQRGTAGWWPNPQRGVRGIITQSPPLGDPWHSAMFSAINVTLVGFTGGHYLALEACGHCKHLQGGSHSFFKGVRFIQDGLPALASWTWQHQGLFKDTDGSLLAHLGAQPNATLLAWNGLMRDAECTRVDGGGALCQPSLRFRRLMLNSHQPGSLKFKDLLITDVETNQTASVEFTVYNEEGYQAAVPVGRAYWLHWGSRPPVDPTQLRLHKLDALESQDTLLFQLRYMSEPLEFSINGNRSSLSQVPETSTLAPHGAQFFERQSVLGEGATGRLTDGGYNASVLWVLAQGTVSSALTVRAEQCPVGGCKPPPGSPVDQLPGQVLWSQAPWPGGPPQAGAAVVIPAGWDVLLDISPPQLASLVIEGNLTFSDASLILSSGAVIVRGTGRLTVGSEAAPITSSAAIVLSGNRGTSNWPPGAGGVIVGSKVLAVLDRARLEMHGGVREAGGAPNAPPAQRWTRLAANAAAGDTQIQLVASVSWPLGAEIVIASTSFNPQQAETRRVRGMSSDGLTLQLTSPLSFNHTAVLRQYSSTASHDMRAEVGLLTSNVVLRAADGPAQLTSSTPYRDRFGCRLLVANQAAATLSGVALEHCGQAGIDRAAIQFELSGTPVAPSSVRGCSLVNTMEAGVRILGSSSPAALHGSVLLGSYDASTVLVEGSGHSLVGNLALGTTRVTVGESGFDTGLLASFEVTQSGNTVQGNVAAGSDQLGFRVAGDPCSLGRSRALFAGNAAHTSLVGLALDANTAGASCTQAVDFAAHLTWDFGIITLKGIPSDVHLHGVNLADNKHAGALILRKGGMTDPAEVRINGGVIAGQSPATCALCSRLTSGGRDAGCHPKLSRQSYNNPGSSRPPWSPSIGLVAATFALDFTLGPEKKPYDALHGYPTIHGIAHISNVTLSDWPGSPSATAPADGCSAGQWALANHPLAPDAAHPHYFSSITTTNSPGLIKVTGPDPGWRNEADCGEANFRLPGGAQLPLNCQGPRHAMFRDVDGSLTGSPGTLVGASAGWPRPSIAQQGPLMPTSACQNASAFDGYFCPAANSSSGGTAVDPQLLVLESRDPDTETRNFGPVLLESVSSGQIDLLIPAMDQGWCFSYTCQKRLSTFWAAVAMGQQYRLTFTGTPARVFRLWLPYAPPGSEVVLALNCTGDPQRRFTWASATQARLAPLEQVPALGDGSGHGAHFWDQDRATMTLKLVGGGGSLEMRTERVIKVTARLALDINAFYDTKELFVANMAALLGIPPSRLRIVSITAGSTIVAYNIAEDPAVADATQPEPAFDTSSNVDAGTGQEVAAVIGQLTPEEQQALFEQTVGPVSPPNAPSPPPPSTPGGDGAAPGSDLAGVLALLKAAIVEGTFEQAAGAPLLGLSLVMPAAEAAAGGGTTGGTTFTLEDIMKEAEEAERARKKRLGGGGIAGIAVGAVAVSCMAAVAAAVVLRRQRTASLLAATEGGWQSNGQGRDVEGRRRTRSLSASSRVHPTGPFVRKNSLFEVLPEETPSSPGSPAALLGTAGSGTGEPGPRKAWRI